MKRIITYFAILACSASFGAEITCYNGKQVMYHGSGHRIRPYEDMLMFVENKSNSLVMILDADCKINFTNPKK